jgi:hypothetical protein
MSDDAAGSRLAAAASLAVGAAATVVAMVLVDRCATAARGPAATPSSMAPSSSAARRPRAAAGRGMGADVASKFGLKKHGDADDGDTDPTSTGRNSHEDGGGACARGPTFPLYAMPVVEFLKLERLEPHNKLLRDGLIKALDFDGEHRDADLNFVSHQWLGFLEADPDCAHLQTMKDIFTRVRDGDPIFRSSADWEAYSKGFTAANAQETQVRRGSGCCFTTAASIPLFF